jgi:tRNA(Ile)-lysidine synthase
VVDKVAIFIKKHDLIHNNSTVIIGVSGGADSLALLHYLWSIREKKDLNLVVAHVDHMFRGKQSAEDMVFVEHFCKKLAVPCVSIQINVERYKHEHQLSTQVAARECRYDFYDQIMKRYNADYLALGHHGDDQIETILMRLTRGSTGIGYAGMQVKRPFSTGSIVRPFLSITKLEIEQYLKEYKIVPRLDPTNEKNDYTRNRYRHHILPYLKQENGQVHERFQNFSEKMIEDQNLLEELTVEKMNTVISEKKAGKVIVDINLFQSIPMPLQRRGIKLILNYLYKVKPDQLSSIHIDNLITLLSGEHPSGELHFPKGLKVVRSYNQCILSFNEEKNDEFHHILQLPSPLSLNNGHEIITEVWEHYPSEVKGNEAFVLDPKHVKLPLIVRSRMIGDRMTLKGLTGSKKVKDIFIDKKIPMNMRNKWPVVLDAEGNIIWLPGLKKSSFEASDFTGDSYFVLYYNRQ